MDEINEVGGLEASENVIDYKDQDGNVLIKIPKELKTKLESRIEQIVEKHNEALNKYRGKRKVTRTSILHDDIKWPLKENSRDMFK